MQTDSSFASCGAARLDDRLRSSVTLLRSAALWACETWPISDFLLKTANSIQLHYIREIIGRKRKPHEEWIQWNQRSLREARVLVHRNKACGGRWSSFILRVRLQLLGHVARHPGPTRDIEVVARGAAAAPRQSARQASPPVQHAVGRREEGRQSSRGPLARCRPTQRKVGGDDR